MEGGTISAFTKSVKVFLKATVLQTNAKLISISKDHRQYSIQLKDFKFHLVNIAFDFKILLTDFVKALIVLASNDHIHKTVIWSLVWSGFNFLFALIDRC